MKRRIPIEQLKPGMHVVGLDLPWLKSPFWIHRGSVKSHAVILELKESGVQEVTIDPEHGLDVEEPVTAEDVGGDGEKTPESNAHGSNPEKSLESAVGSGVEHGFDLGVFEQELRLAQEVRSKAISAIRGVFEGIKSGVVLDMSPLREVTETVFDCLKEREGCVLADLQLQRMMQFDASLFSHSVDVCVLALVVGHHSQMTDCQLQDLAIGALLHDVGQLRLPRNLLSKNGKFNQEERNLYLTHPKLGASILSKAEDVSEASRRVVLEHHEHVDGSGYPWGRKGNTISSLAQLVGLVDRYDALVRKRGGRPPLPPALAVRRLYQLGIDGEFAMEWVEKLVECLGLYPVGSLVELSTGDRGWVISVNQADHMLPTVKLVWNASREKLPIPRVLDLSKCLSENAPVRVLRILNPFEEGIQNDLCFVPELQHASS
jgi:HD-GYP domain-containing protein (c-di-GMP phosphodiesterase class II)